MIHFIPQSTFVSFLEASFGGRYRAWDLSLLLFTTSLALTVMGRGLALSKCQVINAGGFVMFEPYIFTKGK